MLETKARFIQQVMTGHTAVRSAEDLEGGICSKTRAICLTGRVNLRSAEENNGESYAAEPRGVYPQKTAGVGAHTSRGCPPDQGFGPIRRFPGGGKASSFGKDCHQTGRCA